MTFKRLLDEHDRIDQSLGALGALVHAASADPIGAMIALSALANELRIHLAHEDKMLYTNLVLDRDQTYAQAASRFELEFADLRRDWDIYLREWQLDSIAGDWAGFCDETSRMVDRLAQRVRAENEILYLTALKRGVLALNDAKASACAH